MTEVQWVDPKVLIPHPDRGLAGTTLSEDDGKYLMIKESIQESGITDPLKVQSGTNIIIGGHTRHRIALELGLDQIPVRYYDADAEVTRYWMVTDNHKRIGDEKDLMKLAWTFNVVVETVGFSHGGDRSTKDTSMKTMPEIAAMFDMKKANFQRYLRLMDLVEELQELVSRGKIGLKAGALLAGLSPDTQRKVYNSIPEYNLMRSDWNLTESEARSFVQIYKEDMESDTEDLQPVEGNTDNPEQESTGAAEDVGIRNVISTRIERDSGFEEDDVSSEPDILQAVDMLEQGGDRHDFFPAPVEVDVAASRLIEMPERQLVIDRVTSIHAGNEEADTESRRRIEDAAKEKARQFVMMEDVDKRAELTKTRLQVAIQRQRSWLERIPSEIIALRTLVGDDMDDELALQWSDLRDELFLHYKRVDIISEE